MPTSIILHDEKMSGYVNFASMKPFMVYLLEHLSSHMRSRIERNKGGKQNVVDYWKRLKIRAARIRKAVKPRRTPIILHHRRMSIVRVQLKPCKMLKTALLIRLPS